MTLTAPAGLSIADRVSRLPTAAQCALFYAWDLDAYRTPPSLNSAMPINCGTVPDGVEACEVTPEGACEDAGLDPELALDDWRRNRVGSSHEGERTLLAFLREALGPAVGLAGDPVPDRLGPREAQGSCRASVLGTSLRSY